VGYCGHSVDKGQFCLSQIGLCSQKRWMSEKTLTQYSNTEHYMGGTKWNRNDTRMEKRKWQKWSKGKSRL